MATADMLPPVCCVVAHTPAAVPDGPGYHCPPECGVEPGGWCCAELGSAVAGAVNQGGFLVPFR